MYLKRNRSYVSDQMMCLVLLIAGGIHQDRVVGVLIRTDLGDALRLNWLAV